MKLSRRGKRTKHTKRGKHTKRTGKNLRYKGKKVHGSKRYHRGSKRTHKRGRRFHKGGAFPEQTFEEQEPIVRMLPRDISINNKIGTFDLDFKRTDKYYRFGWSRRGNFDVFVVNSDNNDRLFDRHDITVGIILLRHDDDTDTSKYSKRIYIKSEKFMPVDKSLPIEGLRAVNPYNTEEYKGTYTFPLTDFNKARFLDISQKDKILK